MPPKRKARSKPAGQRAPAKAKIEPKKKPPRKLAPRALAAECLRKLENEEILKKAKADGLKQEQERYDEEKLAAKGLSDKVNQKHNSTVVNCYNVCDAKRASWRMFASPIKMPNVEEFGKEKFAEIRKAMAAPNYQYRIDPNAKEYVEPNYKINFLDGAYIYFASSWVKVTKDDQSDIAQCPRHVFDYLMKKKLDQTWCKKKDDLGDDEYYVHHVVDAFYEQLGDGSFVEWYELAYWKKFISKDKFEQNKEFQKYPEALKNKIREVLENSPKQKPKKQTTKKRVPKTKSAKAEPIQSTSLSPNVGTENSTPKQQGQNLSKVICHKSAQSQQSVLNKQSTSSSTTQSNVARNDVPGESKLKRKNAICKPKPAKKKLRVSSTPAQFSRHPIEHNEAMIEAEAELNNNLNMSQPMMNSSVGQVNDNHGQDGRDNHDDHNRSIAQAGDVPGPLMMSIQQNVAPEPIQQAHQPMHHPVWPAVHNASVGQVIGNHGQSRHGNYAYPNPQIAQAVNVSGPAPLMHNQPNPIHIDQAHQPVSHQAWPIVQNASAGQVMGNHGQSRHGNYAYNNPQMEQAPAVLMMQNQLNPGFVHQTYHPVCHPVLPVAQNPLAYQYLLRNHEHNPKFALDLHSIHQAYNQLMNGRLDDEFDDDFVIEQLNRLIEASRIAPRVQLPAILSSMNQPRVMPIPGMYNGLRPQAPAADVRPQQPTLLEYVLSGGGEDIVLPANVN